MHNRLALLCVLSLAGCGASIHDLAAHGENAAVVAVVNADRSVLESRNELGKTALHYAATHNQTQTVALLLSLGADADAQDRTGLTPLHIAAVFGYTDVAGILFSNGASLTIADDFGDTPLHSAALHGQLPMIERLLDWGSDPTETNEKGLTAAGLARAQKKVEASELIEEIAAELQ